MLEPLEIIKRQIGITDNSKDDLLSDLQGRYLGIALAVCNRKEPTDTMQGIVVGTVVEAYNQLGAEGISSYSLGQESQSFLNLQEEMKKRLLDARQRVLRF